MIQTSTHAVRLAALVLIALAEPIFAKPKEICEVLRNLAGHDEERLLVRGLLHVNKYHGHIFLQDVRYRESCPSDQRAALDSPDPAIHVEWAGVLTDQSAKESPEGDPLRVLLTEIAKRDMGFMVMIVLEGHLSVKPGARYRRTPSGKVIGEGFGIEGSFPAAIVIKRIVALEGPVSRGGRHLPNPNKQ